MIDHILTELAAESESTQRLLEAIPADKFSWKPHEKSMTVSALAKHIATIPLQIPEVFDNDSYDMADMKGLEDDCATPEALADLYATSLEEGISVMKNWSEEKLNGEWKLTKEGNTIVSVPRIAGLRNFLLNHLYHHRGQLSVYLRLMEVPVPSVYGPSADVNPFE